MPRLLRDGDIVEDNWLPPNPEGPQSNHLPTLSQWEALIDKSGSAVQLEPGALEHQFSSRPPGFVSSGS